MALGAFKGNCLRYALVGGALLSMTGQPALASNTKKPRPVVQPATPIARHVQPSRPAAPVAGAVHIAQPHNALTAPSRDHATSNKPGKGRDRANDGPRNNQSDSAGGNADTSASTPQFAGIWSNVEQHARGVASIQVTANPDGSASIEVYQGCRPTACDWGSVPAQVQDDGSLIATYTDNFSQKQVTLIPADNGQMQYQVSTHFTDNSGRPDRVSTGTLAQR